MDNLRQNLMSKVVISRDGGINRACLGKFIEYRFTDKAAESYKGGSIMDVIAPICVETAMQILRRKDDSFALLENGEAILVKDAKADIMSLAGH